MEAYCVKCKAKKEIKEPQEVTLKNDKPATQGVCPDCGTKLFRIGGSLKEGDKNFYREKGRKGGLAGKGGRPRKAG